MKILRIFNSTVSNGLKCSEVSRCLHVSTYFLNHSDKVENTKIIYELPEVLKKWEENSANRLKAELGGLQGDIKALQGDIKALQGGLQGDIKGVQGGLQGDIKALRGDIKALQEGLQGDIKALQSNLKGDIKGVQGEIKGVLHKIVVYAGLASTAVGFTLKVIYDYSVTK